jgi:hypothetical protein
MIVVRIAVDGCISNVNLLCLPLHLSSYICLCLTIGRMRPECGGTGADCSRREEEETEKKDASPRLFYF